jgi:cell division protein FtsL
MAMGRKETIMVMGRMKTGRVERALMGMVAVIMGVLIAIMINSYGHN